MDLKARVDVNCERTDGRLDGRTDERTENRTPMSHTAEQVRQYKGNVPKLHSLIQEGTLTFEISRADCIGVHRGYLLF